MSPARHMNPIWITTLCICALSRIWQTTNLKLMDIYSSAMYTISLALSVPKMSQIVGWIYKPEGNENGDNFVDFGILETNRETEDGGYEKAILMEFNVDGPILDLI